MAETVPVALTANVLAALADVVPDVVAVRVGAVPVRGGPRETLHQSVGKKVGGRGNVRFYLGVLRKFTSR